MTARYQPAVRHEGPVPAEALVLACHEASLLLVQGDAVTLPRWEQMRWYADPAVVPLYMGLWDNQPLFMLPLAVEPDLGTPWCWMPLRSLLGQVDDELFHLGGRALQLQEWLRSHRHCGCCGTPMLRDMQGERAMTCPACGHVAYPRINPCVIGVVARGDELLLARSHRFRNGMFSALAGFMEVGESAEQTLVREVREEVGIEIRDIRYFGSQPWPFPSNLMLGFFAEYAGGELRLQDDEIAEAGFFHYERLPLLPPPGSIARALIDHLIAERKGRHV